MRKIKLIAQPVLKKLNLISLKMWDAVERVIISLGGRTIAMLGAALLITIISIIFNDNWILSISRQDAVIGELKTSIVTLNGLRSSLYQAESAQRGYLLTLRPEYAQPYEAALKDARKSIHIINDLIIRTASPKSMNEELSRLTAISNSIEAKASEMKMTIDLATQGKINEALQIINLNQGMIEMHKLMEHTQLLITLQNQNLENLLKKRTNSVILARMSLLVGALVLILLVVLVIKQLLAEISVKSELQLMLAKEIEANIQKLKEQSTLLRSLAFDYQADVERERQKLSRELHDELGSILTATKMDLAWVIKKIKPNFPEIVEKLKKTNSY